MLGAVEISDNRGAAGRERDAGNRRVLVLVIGAVVRCLVAQSRKQQAHKAAVGHEADARLFLRPRSQVCGYADSAVLGLLICFLARVPPSVFADFRRWDASGKTRGNFRSRQAGIANGSPLAAVVEENAAHLVNSYPDLRLRFHCLFDRLRRV